MTQAYTNRFTEVWELFGADADNYAIGVYTPVTYRHVGNHQRAALIVHVGDMGAGATVDLALLQASDAAGLTAKAISGKSITQLTQAGGDAGSTVVIEMRTEEMDVDGGFCYLGATLTVAGNVADIGIVALAGCSNYVPVPVTNWTEIVD
jgi:hypothetical protein